VYNKIEGKTMPLLPSIHQTEKPPLPPKPILLTILDGWGLSSSWGGNAISMNNPPVVNRLWREYPHKILQAFGALQNPYQKVGNSEIGHASIAAGRMVNQDLVDISIAIDDGSFFKNDVLLGVMKHVREGNHSLHLTGLVSDGAVHSHIDHLMALLKLSHAQGIKRVYVHAILDGQDAPATSGRDYIRRVNNFLKETAVGKIATISGRYFAMDRDGHWDRTALAYMAQVDGRGDNRATDPDQAVYHAYTRGYTDYNMPTTVIMENGKPVVTIRDHDGFVFFNSRADRAQQLTRAYLDPSVFRTMGIFRTQRKVDLDFITLTDYKLKRLPFRIAFPHRLIEPNLGSIMEESGRRQLRVAESEKRAHVTYFFSGGRDEPYKGEDRVIVPSKNVESYDQVPEMSAKEITDAVIRRGRDYDLVVVNYANVDLIGHTGNILAAAKAIEAIDGALARLSTAILEWNGAMIVTADHGNAEQMIRLKRGDVDKTEHTLNPVPFILVQRERRRNLIQSSTISSSNMLSDILTAKNTLADVAPTILEMMQIDVPHEMDGKSLLKVLE
jgi:2,3-bisphosphoglycerate-independent phosphoglycerate mutase